MDTVSYNFLWSYCESLFLYGLDYLYYKGSHLLSFTTSIKIFLL